MSPRKSTELGIEYVLLALLDQNPTHGYELYRVLRALNGISLIWHVNQASLYAILDKLENGEVVSSHVVQDETYPPRKVYTLTNAGRDSLQAWLSKPVRRARQFRQEFLAKLIVALHYGRENALELINNQRETCLDWRKELLNNPPPRDKDHLDQWVVHSFRSHRVEALLSWLDSCQQDLNNLV